MFKFYFYLVAVTLFCGPALAAQLESHIPKENVEQFINSNLDLSTFRNSTGPKRTAKTRTFRSLGMVPTLAEGGSLQYNDDGWFYGIKVVERKDYNGDGIEDLGLCFTDSAKKGTYSERKSLLVTRYSEDALLVSLNYEIDVCKN